MKALPSLYCVMFGLLGSLSAIAVAASPATPAEKTLMHHVSGPFDVNLAPQPSDDPKSGSQLGRMSIDKQFHGALEATSLGQMLAFRSGVEGSAGYVAMEQVIGTLDGRAGTFVLQHSATMNRGAPSLSISVVPDSGTGELTGLTGRMNIVIAGGGKHSYEFDYDLPQAP